MAKEKKSYKIFWLDEEGNHKLLETGESSDLKNELFNTICKMIMTAPNIFRLENGNDNIRKMIKTGVLKRENHFAILVDQVLSVIANS